MPPFVEVHIPNYNPNRVPDPQCIWGEHGIYGLCGVYIHLVRRDVGKMSLQMNVLFETKSSKVQGSQGDN